MKRNKKRVVAAVAVIAALAAGGAAFTASLGGSFPTDQVAGFGQTHITGPASDGVHYTLSSDGQAIDSATIYFPSGTDLSGDTTKAGFGDTSTDAKLESCAYDATPANPPTTGDVAEDCDFTTTSDSQYEASTATLPAVNNNDLQEAGEPVANADYFNAIVTTTGSTN
jgi:hypothetical protein